MVNPSAPLKIISGSKRFRVPVLLTTADYYGTLAAARCFGRAGIPVSVADESRSAPARWSRFVARRLHCPSKREPDALLDWLASFGRRAGKHVLAPTCDDTAFLYSLHRAELAQDFALYSPSVETMYALLNKRRLFEHCQALDVATPRTWFIDDRTALETVAHHVKYPALIKPVTQILNQHGGKGQLVDTRAELLRHYPKFRGSRYPKKLLEFDSSVEFAMIQEFFPQAADCIYNLSGFIDASGQICVVRAGFKVLQRPRQLGIGICFEHAPVYADALDQVARLARHVRYYGVFEVEFIRADEKFLLIDFNPRFYSQMAFDIDRGLPIPLFQYYAALGDATKLQYLYLEHRRIGTDPSSAFTVRFSLELLLLLQTMSGALSKEEAGKWRRWYEHHRGHCTDAVLDDSDWLPAMLDAARSLVRYARHPKGFLRSMVLNR